MARLRMYFITFGLAEANNPQKPSSIHNVMIFFPHEQIFQRLFILIFPPAIAWVYTALE